MQTQKQKSTTLSLQITNIHAIISPNVNLDAFIHQKFNSQISNQQNLASSLERLKSYQQDFNLSHLPPLERRRLSNASKCALSLITPQNNAKQNPPQKPMPIVFSSTLGEINRCFNMLLNLQDSYLLSPTSFSMSVLNATPALLAIATKNNAEISAISANPSLEYGIINAYTKLKDSAKTENKINEIDEVLVLSYYEGLCEAYNHYKEHQNNAPLQSISKNEPPFLLLALTISLPNQSQTNQSQTSQNLTNQNPQTPTYNATLEITQDKTPTHNPNNAKQNSLEIITSELDFLSAIHALDSASDISYCLRTNDSMIFKWHITKI
ncbi:beta-ketoacyl synthase chain length factor [Helicobacter sp. T3_23-1056]